MKDVIELEEKSLSYSSFKLLKNGLQPIGSPSFDEWLKCGEFLKNTNGAVHFWIGDWLRFGEKKYGEAYTQAIDETGYEYQTLSNDKWVASNVPLENRRESLSFSHHAQVADLTPEEQKLMLDLAEEKKLNRNDFTKEVRKYKLRLDLPELSEQELAGSSQDFDFVTDIVSELIDVEDKLKSVKWDSLNKDARDFLLSQVRKSFGYMGGVLKRYEK